MIGYLFLLPFLIHFSIFKIYPLFSSIYISFTNWSLMTLKSDLVGFKNYSDVLSEPLFFTAVKNTLYYSVFCAAGVVVFGLAMALALNIDLKGIGIFRTAYYIPVVVDWVIVATVWMFLLDPSFGLINYLLRTWGMNTHQFLQDPNEALPIITLSSIWKGVGYYAVFYLAGLQDIPDSLLEAAKIDGATKWQRFRYVILPHLAPVSLFVVIMATIGALKIFSQIYIMTKGGPARATTTIMYYFYEVAFGYMKMGKGATIAVIFTVFVFVIILIQRKVMGKMSGASGL